MPSLPKIIANSLHYLLSVSFALLTAYTVNSTLESERRLRLELEQESTFEAALVLRSELELKLANTRLIPFTLRSQLRQKTAPNHRYFAELASDFISQSAFIRSIALIEDNVVVDIFPQAYGRIDLGDTFIQGKPNNKDFFIAKSQRETVISAPYIAQQDIMVIDLLTPLFLNSAYWGQINITIDWIKLLNTNTYHTLSKDYGIEIYEIENTGRKHTNNRNTKNGDSIFISSNFIHQRWEIKITPKDQWKNATVTSYHYPVVALAFLFTFIGLFYWLRQNQALRKERNSALDAIKEKNRFLSYAAHDLRQPLSALSFSIEELLQRQQSTLDSRITKNMLNSIQNLNELFDQLLDIEQINNQKKVISVSVIPLHDLVEELSSELDPIFKEYLIELRSHCNNIYVKTDPVLLKRILRNLIINGLESTSRGHVSLSCVVEKSFQPDTPSTVNITVQDTGVGIDSENLENIFDAFQQLNQKKQQISVGIGAGLNIVKSYCQLLGIHIHVESTVGTGSTFTLRLNSHAKPLNSPPTAPQNEALPSPLNNIKAFSYYLEEPKIALIKNWGINIQHCTALPLFSNTLDAANDTAKPPIQFIFIDAKALVQEINQGDIQDTIMSYPHTIHCVITGEGSALESCKLALADKENISFSNQQALPVRFRALLIQIAERYS